MSNHTASVDEAAQRFGVSDKTVRRYIKAGKGPATQESRPCGLAWRIPEAVTHTTLHTVEVIPTGRALNLQTFGLVIAQAVIPETQGLAEPSMPSKRQWQSSRRKPLIRWRNGALAMKRWCR